MIGNDAAAVADTLFREFDSVSEIVDAEESTLCHLLKGREAVVAALISANALIRAGLREHIERSKLCADDPKFLEYLIAKFRGRREETVIAFFADEQGGFISEDLIALGELGSVSICSRALFSKALRLNCVGMVLVHNHPSGIARPSVQDLKTTAIIDGQCSALRINLIDHLIVAGSTVYSMRKAGLL